MLKLYGFNYLPYESFFSFRCINTRDPSETSFSKIDHAFTKSKDDLLSYVNLRVIPDSLIYSDHKLLIIDFILDTDDFFIVGKESRIRVSKLVPLFKPQIVDGKEQSVDIHEQHRYLYHRFNDIDMIKLEKKAYQNELDAMNIHIDDNRRQKAMNDFVSIFGIMLLDNTSRAVGTTLPIPLVTSAEITAMAQEQKVGNFEAAKKIQDEYKQAKLLKAKLSKVK